MTSTRTPDVAGPTAGNELPRTPRRAGFSQKLGRWDVKLSPYLYISPFFILFIVVGLFPLFYTAFVSVHQWGLLKGQGDYVGLENFTTVLQQEIFWKSVRNTISIFLLSSVPQIAIALVVAAILDANLRAKTFWRMGVLVPYVVAPVAVSLIFGRCSLTSPASSTRSCGTWASRACVGTPRCSRATSPSRRWSTSGGPATTP